MKTKRLLAMLLTFVMLMTSVIAAPVTAEAKTKKPAATSIVSLVSKKDKPMQMSIKWKKKKAVKGYQIQYSTSKKFTKKTTKKATVKKAKTTKKTIKKLKANKKYYVRIRTYKTTKGKKVYSKWSKVKAVASYGKGWKKVGSKWTYEKDGKPQKGFIKLGGGKYYFDENGEMAVGFRIIDGDTYYFDENGEMVTGKVTIAGYDYTFDSNGKLTKKKKSSNQNESSTTGDTTDPNNKPVDPATCKHNWVAIVDNPATYENNGWFYGYCSKCGTLKDVKTPKLTFTPDLNTSHYDTWKVTDENNANNTAKIYTGEHIHTKCCENYCKNNNLTPTLKYVKNYWITLETTQERPASTRHTWCTVCECDIDNRFFHDRYYYYNQPNSYEAKRFKAFADAWPWDEYTYAEYWISGAYIAYDAYIHMCNHFNNGNLIIINRGDIKIKTMGDWYNNKFGHPMSQDGIWAWDGNHGWFADGTTKRDNKGVNPEGIDTDANLFIANRVGYTGLDTYNYPLPSNINKNDVQAYWENPTGWTWTEPKLSGNYTGYVWECPKCHGIVPAYHKDDHSMAGAITQYKKTTVTYTPVYEWTNEWCIKKTTKAIDKNQTNIANYKSTFHIVDGRLGEDGQYRK